MLRAIAEGGPRARARRRAAWVAAVAAALAAAPAAFAAIPGGLGAPLVSPVATPGVVQEQPIQLSDPARTALALRFQPTLHVAQADRFWPVSVTTLATLRLRGRSVCVFRSKRDCPDLAGVTGGLGSLAPGDVTDRYLDYSPGAGILTNVDATAQAFDAALGVAAPAPTSAHWAREWALDPSVNPYPTAQEYFFAGRRAPPGAPPGPNQITLEYWFFYGFNYWPIARSPGQLGIDPRAATLENRDYHEGDMEHVSVVVDLRTGAPQGVYYAQHKKGQWLAWPQAPHTGTHAEVWPGIGGHASYAHCGVEKRTDTKLPLKDYGVCREGTPNAPGGITGRLFDFAGGATRLVELDPASWACWPGTFGDAPFSRHLSDIAAALHQTANGPEAPLRQSPENKGVCPPVKQ